MKHDRTPEEAEAFGNALLLRAWDAAVERDYPTGYDPSLSRADWTPRKRKRRRGGRRKTAKKRAAIAARKHYANVVFKRELYRYRAAIRRGRVPAPDDFAAMVEAKADGVDVRYVLRERDGTRLRVQGREYRDGDSAPMDGDLCWRTGAMAVPTRRAPPADMPRPLSRAEREAVNRKLLGK